jgi:tetratricopeptide (TPR) repeat protein
VSRYHYGITIREAREELQMTRETLAKKWPRTDGSVGVSSKYVYLVEKGEKTITDTFTLRELCKILNIEPWKFGLSDFNPFTEESPVQVPTIYEQALSGGEALIKRTWGLRRTAPATYLEEWIKDIENLLSYLETSAPPPVHLNQRFLILSAQLLRLKAVIDVEMRRYRDARDKFEQMYTVARRSGDAGTIAMSLLGKGTEAERAGEQEKAIDLLEQARDESFRASKHVMAITNAYLARCYASNGMAKEFQRAIDTALKIAQSIKLHYGDGTDFVFHSLSGIMAEKSYGLVELGEAQACLDMRDEIQTQINAEGNRWLDAWIPWDWARSHLMLGNIKECVDSATVFYTKAKALRSPHALSRAVGLLVAIQDAGYGERPEVKPFKELVTE